MDFVELTQNDDWAVRPGPQTVQDDWLRRTGFINDDTNVTTVPETNTLVAGVQSTAPESGSVASKELKAQEATLAESFLWPVRSVEEKNAVPYIAALAGSLLFAPIVMPGVALTGYLLSGYVVGTGVHYMSAKLPKQDPRGPIEKFVANRNATDSVIQTSPALPEPVHTSSLEQEIEGLLGAT